MPDLPLIRLEPLQTSLWWLSPGARLLIGRVFSRRYGPCYVCTDDCCCVAKVLPSGKIELAKAPYTRYAMWQMSNNPTPANCHCADFVDPEVVGPWKVRNSERHHPMCIYDRTSQVVFSQFARNPMTSQSDLKRELDHQRPDAWVLARDVAEDHAPIRSR